MQQRIDKLFAQEIEGTVFISGFANIFYYSGFTSADAYLLLTPVANYIITDSRYFVQARLESPDFELIDIKKGWEYVFGLTESEQIFFEEDNLNYGMYKKLSPKAHGKEFVPAQSKIDFPRQKKDKRELEIIKLRYGIGGYPELTQHEIAKRLNISRSYVSRIEKSALEKLRRKF